MSNLRYLAANQCFVFYNPTGQPTPLFMRI